MQNRPTLMHVFIPSNIHTRTYIVHTCGGEYLCKFYLWSISVSEVLYGTRWLDCLSHRHGTLHMRSTKKGSLRKFNKTRFFFEFHEILVKFDLFWQKYCKKHFKWNFHRTVIMTTKNLILLFVNMWDEG